MKKKKECSPATNEARAKQSMKKKKEEAPKYRNWEKDRRDRLNVAFNQLALAISNDSPPVKKIDIVTKACECIELLRQENEQIKKDSGLDQTLLDKETSKYKEQIAELVSRINRLVSYLTELGVDKPQWVSLPPTTPAPPDLGRRPFQYSNKLNVSKVKELLEMPKNKVTKRLQNAKKRALKKKAVVVKKKAVVPKVTSLSQLPPGILLFKSCPPENTPKVVIVPPPAPAAAISTPLILLPPPQQKTQIILSKPPANKVPIRCEVKKTSVKKAKKALMNKNSKAIRHSIEALCKKQLEKETPAKEAQPAQTSQPEPGNANSDRTEAKQSNKATEPDKENIFVPIIRPTTPTAPSKPASQPTQAQQAQPVNQPVVQPEKIVTHVELPVVSSSSLQANQCQEVSKSSVSASGPQFSMPTLTTAQAKQVFTGNSYPVNSSRSYPDTQTTFSHLNQTPTHFHAPHLAPSQDKAQNKSTPFTHEAPAPLNPVSQADTFSHLKTHLPTFSTFGDISGAHCNQTFTTTASTHQKTPFSSASDIFTHQPQNKSLSFSQGQSFPPKPSNPTFTHEKVHQQQMQKPSTQFDALLQPSQDQRPVYFDLARLPEYNSGDTGFIGPQPPTATVVEHPPKDPGSMYNPFRGDEMSEGVQRPDQNLNSSTYSNDLFASLHVPSGHPESISPTAAFLHTFPLVSAGRNENSERVETGASNLMQLGNLEEGGQQMELNSLIPQMDKQSKRGNKSFSDDLYQMEPDYDAEITSIMSSTPKRQNKQNPFQHQQSKPQQQQQQQQPPPQPNFGYYQQQKRTIAAPQKPVQRETTNRTSEQSNYKSSHNYPFYYQTADQTPPAAPLNLPPVPTTNFMPWNNIEPQQHQSSRSVQQSYSCESRQVNHQSIPAPSQQQQQSQQVQQQQQPQPQQQQQQQQQQQKEVQRPPVNWMTSDVRTDDTAVGILDFEWSRQAQLPTLVGDLALGPTPPTPRKKDNTCKYTSGQNFLSVSQLVDVPKEKAKRRLINSSNKNNSNRRNERNTAKQPASIQQQQQQLQVCPDYHSITNWPAPKPSCKPVPSSYSAESLIGTSQHDQNEKSERYNQRFPRNYLPSEQNSFFPSEQQFDYHQHQYDCSSSYQPNTSFASIVTTSSSTNSIVPSFGQDFIPFSSTPQKSMSNNKRRNDNFYNPDCNRRSIQQYNQQSRTNQQVNASHSAGSSLTNFNMCTLFPEINKQPVIAPPLAPFIPSKGQVSDYVLPPPPASFNNLLAPAPPQVFPAPSFPVPSSIQFPTQNEN